MLPRTPLTNHPSTSVPVQSPLQTAAHLRPYQRAAIDAVQSDWRAGLRDLLLVLATGGGKTHVFLSLTDEELQISPQARILIIAHRRELISQPLERLREFWPHLVQRAGIVMAARRDVDAQIVIGTVQSLTPHRLEQILNHGAIDLVITDEAHHSVATGYRRVYDRLKEANPQLRHLGVTATPLRTDKRGLIETFQKVSFKAGIAELVPEYLVPPRWLAIATGISLRGVRRTQGDYAANDLAQVYEVDNTWDLVVATHRKYAADRKAVAFTPTVAGAYALAQAFNNAGIPAIALDGSTKTAERDQALADFKAGKYQVLCNCLLFTEGWDSPETSCIHQVRPTQSDGLYAQMIGRVLRPFPGKSDALILDYAPQEARNVAMLGDLLGVPKQKQVHNGSAPAGAVLGGFTYDGSIKGIEGDPSSIVARQLNYLEESPHAWNDCQGWLVLGLGKLADVDRLLAMSPHIPGFPRWLYRIDLAQGRPSEVHAIGGGHDFEALSTQAQRYAEIHGNRQQAEKDAPWRKKGVTDAQKGYIRSLLQKSGDARGLLVDFDTLNRGDAGRLISFLLAKIALRKAGRWYISEIKESERHKFDDAALKQSLQRTPTHALLNSLDPQIRHALSSVVRREVA